MIIKLFLNVNINLNEPFDESELMSSHPLSPRASCMPMCKTKCKRPI